MAVVIQYPDLTEYFYGYETGEHSFQTEFAFHLAAAHSEYGYRLHERGFKPVSAMNNWWPTHAGESRKLTLWWKKKEEFGPAPVLKVRRYHWDGFGGKKYNTITQHLAGSGCGFKIGELPFRVRLFNRFFTLMRLPV